MQAEYERFWKITEIFKEWSSGVKTHRDHFIVGFTKEEIKQKMRTFTGDLSDDLVAQSLNLNDTRDWKLKAARESLKKIDWKEHIKHHSYRPFDNKYICYLPELIDRGCDRWDLMKNFFEENIGLTTTRRMAEVFGVSAFVCNYVGDIHLIGDQNYFFPLYLYHDEMKLSLRDPDLIRDEAISKDEIPRCARNDIFEANFTSEFLQTIKESLDSEPMPEEIFYYIYAVLYSPTYRKRYKEFLKIDFPRIPLLSNYGTFKKLSDLGKELVELHLLKHSSLDTSDIGFPESGSNKVEKVVYDEVNRRVFLNKEQYFEGVSKEVWEYRIGAHQVMEKYLKDRKGRKLSLDEINHYMKMAKAIRLTIKLQEEIDEELKCD